MNEAGDAPERETNDGTARAGTGVGWLELRAGVPPATKGTGTGSPPKNLSGKVAGPNELKLSDGGRKDEPKRRDVPPPFAGARG